MAFPVPDHLPKRPAPVDVSSQILYKIDSATKDTLHSSLAASWLRELEDSIQATKQRIHDRIQSDLPKFNHQLETSKAVQARYESLVSRADELNEAISNPNTGFLPTLVETLSKHSSLAQETSDAEALDEGFSYLLRCRNVYSSLVSMILAGELPEGVTISAEVQQLLEEMPPSLTKTAVAEDLKHKFNASRARIQDQLTDAYSKSIIISPKEITIRAEVQVRGSDTMLKLSALLHSLSPATLSGLLSTLRRNLLTHFVDHALTQPYSLLTETSIADEVKLSLIPSPPNSEDMRKRLDNLSIILDFLSVHLFPRFPQQEAAHFTRSLSKPITNSVLNNLLTPFLPSSFGLLPSFLDLLRRAVSFEEKDIQRLLEGNRQEGSIKAWSDGVSGHYERRRRVEILEHARKEIVTLDDIHDTFKAVSDGGPETSLPTVVPVQEDEAFKDDAWGFDEPVSSNPVEDNADGWGFDEPTTPNAATDNADSWGFDDGMDPDPAPEARPETPSAEAAPEPMEVDEKKEEANGDAGLDPGDAWGWNDDADLPAEDNPEDNPWDDPWSDPPGTSATLEPPPPPPPANIVVSPKAATRLEKLATKQKKQLNGQSSTTSTPLSSPPIPEPTMTKITFSPPSPPPEPERKNAPENGRLKSKRPPEVVTTIAPQEHYLVPKQAKRVLKMVETVIDESKLFYASNLFPASKGTVPAPGSILLQSTSSILDLYEALYPVKHAKALELPERGMLFSNSCVYLTGAVQRLEDTIYGQSVLKERLVECRRHLQILGDSWYDGTIEREQQKIDKILVDGARGFAYTADQDRYDECEQAVNDVLKDIKRLAQRLKGILSKSKYFAAIGSVADSALSRVLRDILALPDIPEIESHRLSELCRILNALEGLFSDNPEQPSFVVAYVPNWLKFSYLSELLEASLADITYLFEQGALVDFQVHELVNLVRALFADTLLRTNTINKLLNGHPAPS
ncbi:hypothetical protein NLJ89_g4287 [Agrocybe chaxingu]|uniref:ZW10 C-terminal helical domain-containing protein n=1 Tax=Agrocybe chaxingu TaxID=84603 RepID=A0A9W8K3L0_9AGAR|nr:hypothetical protein NLJ89_g4287 [Agrocybe chaxingu]